jgi:MFS family permease
VAIGLLLSTGMVSLMSTLSGDAFATWGWRVPFLFSIVLIGIGLWIRLGVLESPMFAKEIETKTVEKQPTIEVVKRHPKEILLSALLRMGEQMPFYIFTVFVLEYGTGELGKSDNFMTNSVMAAAALSLFSIPFFGHLSDRIGRKRLYMTGAAIMGVWAFAYFGLLNAESSILIFVAVFLSLIPHDIQYGPQAALIAESFPTKLRYSGAGIGYQLSSVFAGGPAPLVATFLFNEFNSTLPIAIYIALGAVCSFVSTALLPEPGRQEVEREFTSVDEAIPETAKQSRGKMTVTS